MPSRLMRFKPLNTRVFSLLTASCLILSYATTSSAVDYYGNGNNGNQTGYQSAPIYYPPVTRGDNQSAIVPVTSSKTGAHVVLGGTVVPYREVTLTAQLPGRVEYIAGEADGCFEVSVPIRDRQTGIDGTAKLHCTISHNRHRVELENWHDANHQPIAASEKLSQRVTDTLTAFAEKKVCGKCKACPAEVIEIVEENTLEIT